jgi:hypothetical protein
MVGFVGSVAVGGLLTYILGLSEAVFGAWIIGAAIYAAFREG